MNAGKCPQCRARLIQKSLDGKIRLRASIVVFDEKGHGEGVCKQCGTSVPLDIYMGESLKKSIMDVEPKLVLRK